MTRDHATDLVTVDRTFGGVDAYDLAIGRLDGEPGWGLLYTRGIALERSKQWERAEDDFLRALELSPDQPLVLNYLGYSWVEQGVQLERAKKMIETAVEKRPRDGYITDSLGWTGAQVSLDDTILDMALGLGGGLCLLLLTHRGDARLKLAE